MRACLSVFLTLSTLGLTLIGCDSSRPVDVSASAAARVISKVAPPRPPTTDPSATLTTLPGVSDTPFKT